MSLTTPDETRPPRVSVISIFYNADEFFDEAIRSVLAQTYKDFEFLLCDDGSTDGSTAAALDWQAREPGRVRHLEHPGHVNRGMSATRNLGIDAARGEFIAFIDADDVWRPDKLAEQVALMDAHPELGMVCGTVRYWASWEGGEDVIVPTGHVRNQVVPAPEASVALYPLGSAGAPCPSDMLLRRAAVESVGGFEAHFTGPRQMYEDQGFLAKLYLTWPVWFSDVLWLDYRQHARSAVATVVRDGGYRQVRRYFLEWFEGYLDDRPEPAPPAVRAALTRALRPYRRPVVHAVSTAPRRLAGRARRLLRAARSRSGS